MALSSAEGNTNATSVENVGLTEADEPWLQELTGHDINGPWLQHANGLLVSGVAHYGQPQSINTSNTQCRDYFYEEMIGFGRSDAPSYGLGRYHEQNRRHYPPTDRFVGANRFFASKSVGAIAIAKTFPDGWTWSTEALNNSYDRLELQAGTERTTRLVMQSGRILAHKNAPASLAVCLRMARVLEWPEENVDQLLVARAQTLRSSPQLLTVFARYFAEKLPDEGVHAGVISNLMCEHPDRHLVALEKGVKTYSRHYIRKATEGMTTAECNVAAGELLEDEQVASLISPRTVAAHRRLHAQQTKS